MRPLAAHCHFGLGVRYQLTGERQRAREQLVVASQMYRDMEMTCWLVKAQAAIGSET
jgi:hypothetical protein